jgi:hypothetical protein
MSSPFHRRHDRLHRLRQAYRDQSLYASQMERSAARWKRAALYRSETKVAGWMRWFCGGLLFGLLVDAVYVAVSK